MEISQFSDGRLRSEPVAEARDFASVRIATTAAWTILSSRRSGSGFVLGRKPARKRMRAKQREFKDQLLATLHDGIEVQRRWLADALETVITIEANAQACPSHSWLVRLLRRADEWLSIPTQIIERCRRAIPRCSQRHRLTSLRMKTIADRCLPRQSSKIGARCGSPRKPDPVRV